VARQSDIQRLIADWVRFEAALMSDRVAPWRGYDRRHQQGHLTAERAREEAFAAAMLAREYSIESPSSERGSTALTVEAVQRAAGTIPDVSQERLSVE
jgi:hypothetical protein